MGGGGYLGGTVSKVMRWRTEKITTRGLKSQWHFWGAKERRPRKKEISYLEKKGELGIRSSTKMEKKREGGTQNSSGR